MEESVKYPKFRWYVMLTMLIAMVVQSIIMISPAPLVGELSKVLNTDVATVSGTVMPVWNIFLAIGGILGGFLLDKFGVTKTFIVSYIVLIIGTAVMPVLGTGLWTLVALRGIMGLGAGPINGCDSRVAADWFPKHERPIVTGIMGVGISLGVAIGFVFAPNVFASTHNLLGTLGIEAIFPVIGLILIIIMAFGPKAPNQHLTKVDEKQSQTSLKKVLSVSETWTCFLSVILLCWVFTAFNDLTPGYIAIPAPMGLGHGPVDAGNIMSIFQIAFMAGSLLSGFFVSVVFKGNEKPVVSIGFIVAAIFMFSVGQPFVYNDFNLLTVCLVIAGFFAGMPNAPIFGFISKYYPQNVTGRLGGIAMGLGVLFGAIAVMVGAACLHATGNYHLSIIVVSVVAVLGFLNSLRLKKPKEFSESPDKNTVNNK